MKKQCWNSSVNKSTGAIDILFHDVIGFWGTQSGEFKTLLNDNKGKTLNIDINSPGGSVFDGFSIYNSLKSHTGKVNMKVSGVAASIASVIFLAGDKREMSENAEIMMHKVTSGSFGNSEEMRKTADRLDRLETSIVNVYNSHMPNNTVDEIQEMLSSETWFTATEALDNGLTGSVCDKCEESNQHAFEAFNYSNIPERVKNKFQKKVVDNDPKKIKVIDQNKTTGDKNKPEESIMDLEKLKAEHSALYNQVINEGITQGVTKERDRVSAHLIMGESSGANKLAAKAIKDGTEMNATMQARYMAAGMNKTDLDERSEDDKAAALAAENKKKEDDKKGSGDDVANLVENKLGITSKKED